MNECITCSLNISVYIKWIYAISLKQQISLAQLNSSQRFYYLYPFFLSLYVTDDVTVLYLSAKRGQQGKTAKWLPLEKGVFVTHLDVSGVSYCLEA